MDRGSFPSLSRQTEEQYFLEREKQLIEQLRKKAAAEASRRDLAEAVGVSDDGILNALEELGYNRDVVVVLHLFPLVAVAWADGEVSREERKRILEAARAFHIEPETPAHAKLEEWLTTKPSEVEIDRAFRILRDIMQFRSEEKQEGYRSRMADFSRQVAEASGGFLGLGRKISAAEKAVLDRVAAELTDNHPDAASKLLGEKNTQTQ